MTKIKADGINPEIEWVRKNLETLAQQYGEDEYFAVKNQWVVDHDSNSFDLMMRVTRKYGDAPVYVTNVFEYKEIAQEA